MKDVLFITQTNKWFIAECNGAKQVLMSERALVYFLKHTFKCDHQRIKNIQDSLRHSNVLKLFVG